MGYLLLKTVMDFTTLSSRKMSQLVLPPTRYEITYFAITDVISIIFATYSFIIREESGISNVSSFSLGISGHSGHHRTEALKF